MLDTAVDSVCETDITLTPRIYDGKEEGDSE